MNDLKETAIKYGVPMPETCKKLDLPTKLDFKSSVFNWLINPFNDEFYLCIGKFMPDNFIFYACAPQMHEIAPLLPKQLLKKGCIYNFNLLVYNHELQGLNYCVKDVDKLIELLENEGDTLYFYADKFKIKDNHFAEAYAQMYLKLKENGLLNT